MIEKDVAIIIPSYKPDEEIMLSFINELKNNFEHIIVVNDGSGSEYNEFFNNLKQLGIDVLTHNINLGKGRALKTAFNHFLNNYTNIIGAITADCDGQHCIEDIKKCSDALKQTPNNLIIGVRNFNSKDIPLRSKFGNKVTCRMFGMFVGIKITDTQTGLRGFSQNLMKSFLETFGERYEYETNMLIECKEKEIKIEEVPINTVYINKNESSHFNPIKDSIMIYKLFIKYIISALSSFVLDLLLFTIFINILPNIEYKAITTIVISTIIARVISSAYNYIINAKLVFKNKNKTSMLKYYILVLVQMLVSAFTVSALQKITNQNSVLIKTIVDSIIFVINFIVQREFIFKSKNN